jgi:hypothetical protein
MGRPTGDWRAQLRRLPAIGPLLWYLRAAALAPYRLASLQRHLEVVTEQQGALRSALEELGGEELEARRALELLRAEVSELRSRADSLSARLELQAQWSNLWLGQQDQLLAELLAEAGRSKLLAGERPIFLHSIFRSGSTYLQFKFRGLTGFWSYHEPLHEQLQSIAVSQTRSVADALELARMAESLHHPLTDKNYFHEYPLGSQGGVLAFPAAQRLELPEDAEDPGLLRYLQVLVGAACGRPVFKFTRSGLLQGWMRRRLGGVHVYLARNPREQFASFLQQELRGDGHFLGMVALMVAHSPRLQALHPALAGAVGCGPDQPLPLSWQPLAEVIRLLPVPVAYQAFHALWALSLLEALRHSDFLLSLDRLAASSGYRLEAEEYFRGIGVPIDFSDIRLGRQTTQLPPERELERLEDQTWQKLELEAAGPELQRARELERALLAALP